MATASQYLDELAGLWPFDVDSRMGQVFWEIPPRTLHHCCGSVGSVVSNYCSGNGISVTVTSLMHKASNGFEAMPPHAAAQTKVIYCHSKLVIATLCACLILIITFQ